MSHGARMVLAERVPAAKKISRLGCRLEAASLGQVVFLRSGPNAKSQVADSARVAGEGQSDKKCPDNFIRFVFNNGASKKAQTSCHYLIYLL